MLVRLCQFSELLSYFYWKKIFLSDRSLEKIIAPSGVFGPHSFL